MGAAPDRERELCLAIAPAQLPGLRSFAPVAQALAAPPEALETAYYDTGDQAFRRRGFALRLRWDNGAILQTVKTAGTDHAGLKDRREIETELETGIPDPARITDETIRTLILDQLAVKDLKRLFRTRIARRRIKFAVASGTIVEVAIDQGEICAGAARETVSEIELELKKGDPEGLFFLARQIADLVPVRINGQSKADRGYALACGEPVKPVKAIRIVLGPEATAEEAFIQAVTASAGQLIANEPSVLFRRDDEGVHQMRVSLRRMRAAMGIFRKPIGRPLLGPLQQRASAIARNLGTVRDLDVLVGDVIAPAGAPDDPCMVHMIEVVESHRAEAWDGLVGGLSATSQTAGLVLHLGHFLETRPWAKRGKAKILKGPARDYAASVLAVRAARVQDWGARLESLTIDERHRMRIEIKKLRYAGEFFASLYEADAVQRYLRSLSQLQDTFGALNDVETARRLLPALAPPSIHADLQYAAGVARVLEWHEARAARQWQKAAKRWRRFEDIPPFWQPLSRR